MTQQTQTDDHIRDAAYFLWLKDGQPEGRDQEHWLAAQAELTQVAEAPKPKAPRKKAAAKPRAAKAAAATKAEAAAKPAAPAKPKKPRAPKAAAKAE